MARRTFANLKTEHILRVGRVGDTAYATRAEEFIKAAYFKLATDYFHHELLLSTSVALSAGTHNGACSIPTDCHVIVQARLISVATGLIVGPLDFEEPGYFLAAWVPIEVGMPTKYTRFGASLFTNKNPPTSGTYSIHFSYHQFPAEPTFAGATSALEIQWDEAILDLSVQWGAEALWRPDIADRAEKKLATFLAMTPRLLLKEAPIHGKPIQPTIAGQPIGGPQG